MRNSTQPNLFVKSKPAPVHYHLELPGSDDILRLWDTRTAAVTDLMERIAHRWRQPLSTVALIMQDLHDSHAHGELDAAYFDRQLDIFMKEVMLLSGIFSPPIPCKTDLPSCPPSKRAKDIFLHLKTHAGSVWRLWGMIFGSIVIRESSAGWY